MFGYPGGSFGGSLFSLPDGDLFGGGGTPFSGGGPVFSSGSQPKGKAPANKAVKYETLYHGTNGEWADSIGKKGLLPSTNGRLGPGVYLTPKKEAAWLWAKWNNMPYVLTCKVPSDEISQRETHPGYPERDMPPFPEVVVRNSSAVEITHVKGFAFVDHAIKEKKQPPQPTASTFKPSKPDPNGVKTSQCHLRDMWRLGSSNQRCPKCCRPLAPNGEWVCKKCGKCSNCQPHVPDPSVKRDVLVEAGLHHFVAACNQQKAEDQKAAAKAAAAAKAEARAKAAEEKVAKAAADAAAKAVAKAVAKAAPSTTATPSAAASAAPSVTTATDRGSQVACRLAEHRLEEYSARLIGEGFDDLEDLLSMSKAELEQVAERCGMKPGHCRRLLKACGHLCTVSGMATDALAPVMAQGPVPAAMMPQGMQGTTGDLWACSACTYRNDANAHQCCMCDMARSAGPSGRAQEDPIVIDDSDDEVDEPAAKRAKSVLVSE